MAGTNEAYKVYVRSLPQTVTEEELKEFFSRAGEVVDSIVRESRNGKYAFVGFDKEEDFEEALKLDGSELNGTTIEVQKKGAGGASDKKCFCCGQVGHISSRCPNGGKDGQRTCYKCGKRGHISRDCRGGDRRRSRSIDNRRRRDDSRDRRHRRDDSRDRRDDSRDKRRRRDDSRDKRRRRDDSRDRRDDSRDKRRRDDSRDKRRRSRSSSPKRNRY